MPHLLLGLCIGMRSSLIATFVIIRKVNGKSELLRERLAAEEATKRHFIQLAYKHEATNALKYQEQKRWRSSWHVERECRKRLQTVLGNPSLFSFTHPSR